jgi:hypothetical protein
MCWSDPAPGAWFPGAPACLSALLAAGRHDDLLTLLAMQARPAWPFHRFGVLALAAQGRVDEAIEFAETVKDFDGRSPGEELCEDLLLRAGRRDEAWQRYGPRATRRGTYLATFRAVATKYPQRDRDQILRELVAASPGREGKWFATAVRLGRLRLALELIRRSPTGQQTALRVAHNHSSDAPEFAREVAVATLRWMFEGLCHGATEAQAFAASRLAVECTVQLGGDPEETVRRILKLARGGESHSLLASAVARHFVEEPRKGPRAGRAPSTATDLPLDTSASRAFVEFLQPLLDGLGGDKRAWQESIRVGEQVWNSIVLEESGGSRKHLRQAREGVAGTPLAGMVEMLVAHKRNRFRDHMWFIGESELLETDDGEFRLRVEARSAFAAGEE